MKKIDKNTKLKRTVSKDDYKQFFRAFKVKPSLPGLYNHKDTNVDYHFLRGEATKLGITKIPSQEELEAVVK